MLQILSLPPLLESVEQYPTVREVKLFLPDTKSKVGIHAESKVGNRLVNSHNDQLSGHYWF